MLEVNTLPMTVSRPVRSSNTNRPTRSTPLSLISPSKDRKEFAKDLSKVFDPDNSKYTAEQAIERLLEVLNKWSRFYPKLQSTAQRNDLDSIFTYLLFDYRIRRMIYTTNWIERLNKSFRRTLNMRNALPTPKAAITLLGYVAMETGEKTYSYPITNFRFDSNFN